MRSFVYVSQVDFVSSPIKRFTKTGIETEDGQTKDLDLVFCATGKRALLSSPPSLHPRSPLSLTITEDRKSVV